MTVRIGHASIDERGKAYGGAAGDQTGKEVCVRDWYSKPWQLLLRHPDAAVAEKAAQACEAGCANSNIGYDQYQRNTAHTLAIANGYQIGKLGKCETDCSAFMTLCYIAAGAKALEYPKDGNAPTTSTMRTAFKKAGFSALSSSKYLSGTDYLRRGDVLVSPGKHTVMVLDNGSKETITERPSDSQEKNDPAGCLDKTLVGTYETKTYLNMRRGAGTEKDVITVIPAGRTVRCFGYCGRDTARNLWLYVQYDGKEGYCSYRYLAEKA